MKSRDTYLHKRTQTCRKGSIICACVRALISRIFSRQLLVSEFICSEFKDMQISCYLRINKPVGCLPFSSCLLKCGDKVVPKMFIPNRLEA